MAQITITSPAGDDYVNIILQLARLDDLFFEVRAISDEGFFSIDGILDVDSLIQYRLPLTTAINSDGSFSFVLTSTDTSNAIGSDGEILVKEGTTTSINIAYNCIIYKTSTRKELFQFNAQMSSSQSNISFKDFVESGIPVATPPAVFNRVVDTLIGDETDKSPSVRAVNQGLLDVVVDTLVDDETELAPSVRAVNQGLLDVGGLSIEPALVAVTSETPIDSILEFDATLPSVIKFDYVATNLPFGSQAKSGTGTVNIMIQGNNTSTILLFDRSRINLNASLLNLKFTFDIDSDIVRVLYNTFGDEIEIKIYNIRYDTYTNNLT